MKINKQDEYGLRILLRIARAEGEEGLSIPQLSELEGLSQPYVAKITRTLRVEGLIESTRGQKGGYIITKSPDQIKVKEVLDALGGLLFAENFCGSHSGQLKLCTNSVDCSVRSLWTIMQYTLDRLLENITIQDLIGSEEETMGTLQAQFNLLFQNESHA